jgi:RNA polymerase sigma-70 factor (ECF subfamily)
MEAMTRPVARQQADALASAAAGDEVAFRTIIAAHHEDMRRVCLAVAGDHSIAEEAVQAAWLVAWRKLGNVHGPDHLRPWLVSVAVTETRQLLRKRRRRAELEITVDASGEVGGIDPATGVGSVDLRAALRRLDADDRALLVMRYGAGFTSTELSIASGKSPAAIRQRLKRLVDRLREDLIDD